MSNDLIAVLIVIAIPVAALLLVAGAIAWSYDAVNRSSGIGGVGVAAAAAATANLFLVRSCGDGVNRPVISMFIGDHGCHRTGLIAAEVLLLFVVGTSVLVRLRDLRR